MAKSVEVKLNEALEKLKKTSATKFAEVSAKIREGFISIEKQLTMVEAGVAEAVKESSPLGLTDIEEARRDPSVAILFDVEPRQKATTKEANATPIKKKNGAIENFVEGSPFNSERSTNANNTQADKTVGKKERLVEHMVKNNDISEAEARGVLGLKEKMPDGLTRLQECDYRFARRCGINEADAMTLAKLPLRASR
jgi:hypothetical protein